MRVRKLETQAEREKRKKRNQVIIGFLMTFLLVLSVAGYALFSKPGNAQAKRLTYNNIVFIFESGMWHFSVHGRNFATVFSPLNTTNISLPHNLEEIFANYTTAPLYFVTNNIDAVNELMQNLGSFIPRAQLACIQGEKCEGNLPVKNCQQHNIIIIKDSNTTRVSTKQNCLVIEGNYEEQLKIADAIIFRLLGIQ